MTILECIIDRKLFRPFLADANGDLSSWMPWLTALRALYGHKIESPKGKRLVEECTGRQPSELPEDGFKTALFLVGRRSGKSRISAIIGAYETAFGKHEERLSPGEVGQLPIVSPTREQSAIVFNYLKAIFEIPLFASEVFQIREREKIIELRNGLLILVATGVPSMRRGFTNIAAVIDEVCFFHLAEEGKVRSDTEIVRALRPGLLTTGGKLICISSKYARRGWAFGMWKKYHGVNREESGFSGKWHSLVWDTDSRTMNPTLSKEEIAREIEEDPVAGRSEFLGEWRDDVAEFVPRSLVESLVIPHRKQLMRKPGISYRAGVDLSGGRSDSASLCIVHKEGGTVIEDFVKEWKAPFNPFVVVAGIAAELKKWGLTSVEGDAYAGEWPVSAFKSHGIRYRPASKPKNSLYAELLPVLCGGKDSIELLDDATQTNQLASLERRTRSGGKDVIDHPANGHDDVSNSLAVAVDASGRKRIRIGAFDFGENNPDSEMRFNRQVLARVLAQ